MTEGPSLAREDQRGDAMCLVLIPEYKEVVERLLNDSREREASKDVRNYAPESLPSEFTITRLMLETLHEYGELNFHEFSRRSDIKSPLRDGSISGSFFIALTSVYRQLGVPFPE